ncbi:MAG TPA: hypothetical protein VHM26_17280 [Chitinophagaceae bacterium]|jgi:hypothetical protein|nr:hypothetical protein [Chitinophagaceae bacterium]
MPTKKDDKKSDFKMFWSSISFTNEPIWYRLVVILIMVSGIVLIAYILKQWLVVPVVGGAVSKIRSALDVINQLRGKG